MKTKEMVHLLLESDPRLREEKKYMVVAIWKLQCQELGITDLDGLFTAVEEGQLRNPETIRRSVNKVMESNPHLRPTEDIQQRNWVLEQQLRQNGGEL